MKNLTEKALLVNLTISQWTARKHDKTATQEVNTAHNSKDAGRFNKILIGKEHLQDIQAIGNRARTFHYENTLPWSDAGERLLPSENYFDYINKLAEFRNEFEVAVNKFCLSYPSLIDQAKANLNGLFNERDYPLNVREKFDLHASFMPVPDVQDIRVNLSAQEIEHIRKTMGLEISDRFANAQKDIYRRISEQLRHMHERLGNDENNFKNSLFENVLELVRLIPRLNVAEDKNISDLCEDLNSLYVDPEQVRTDKKLRSDKAKEVQAMLSKMDSFLKA